jgi:hypothetical protein
MAVQQTSFQKKTKSRVPYIPGSRPSIQNAQLLVSSGVPSFDHAIGNDFYHSISHCIILCILSESNYPNLLIFSSIFAVFYVHLT